MRFIKSRFLVFLSTFIIGWAAFWVVMLALTILDTNKILDKKWFNAETQEIIRDIQCGDDEYCRGEKCGA